MNALIESHNPARLRTLVAGVLFALVWCAQLSRARAGEDGQESLGQIVTADGSIIQCMIAHPAPWTIATSTGVQNLKFELIQSIALGERIDPNVENEASVAVGDLQSDKFETREKAEATLRSMGRAAARALKQALALPDADVSKRARTLLAEMGALENDGSSQDRVQLRDGKMLRGELSVTDVTVRSHFGRLRIPVEALEKFIFNLQVENKKPDESFAPIDAKEIAVPLPVAGRVEAASAQNWDPTEDARTDPSAMDGWLAEAQRNALTMDKIPDKKAAQNGPQASVETKPGDRLEDAYAERGVLLRATETGANVEVSAEKIQGFSGGRCLTTKQSDLEVRFILAKAGGAEPAGVLHAGAVVRTLGPGTMGIAAYDAAGRLLAQTLNTGIAAGVLGPPMQHDEFLGVRSKTPIARLRFFRVGAMKEKNTDLLLDDLLFDRVSAAGLRGDECRVTLPAGDRIVGKPVAAENDAVALKAEFLGDQAAPLTFKLSALSRYEPARGAENKDAEKTGENGEKEKPRRFGTPHGVLLQSGETFRARLLALDGKTAAFGLSGGALLKLPRETLRKIELIPKRPEPNEVPAPTAMAPDEKPGVEFKTKPLLDNPAAPQPKEEKKDPAHNPAQGLPRMDNAEILSIDPQTHELTVKDEDGEMTMNLAGIKTLVFPPNPNAGAAAKKRAWSLTLREGSRFDADILKITPKEITAEMAGGTVLLPAETIEAVERK